MAGMRSEHSESNACEKLLGVHDLSFPTVGMIGGAAWRFCCAAFALIRK